MYCRTDRGDVFFGATLAQKGVVTAAASNRTLSLKTWHHHFKYKSCVVFQRAAKLCFKFRMGNVNARIGHELQTALVGIKRVGNIDIAFTQQVLQPRTCGTGRRHHPHIAFKQVCGVCRQRLRLGIGNDG